MTKRRIMLLAPPLRINQKDLKMAAIHLGLQYIASYLENNGHKVSIIDLALQDFTNIRHATNNIIEYGSSNDDLIFEIDQFDPDIIGIGLSASVNYPAVLDVAHLIRKRFPKKLMLVGGAHATALPEKTLRDGLGSIDFVVIGEGEVVMKNIVDSIDNVKSIKNIRGVAYLENDCFHSNHREPFVDNLDFLGLLDHSLIQHIPMTEDPSYAGPAYGKQYVDIIFSRGCPRNCGFCFSPSMWLNTFRTHSIDWIERQLELYIRNGIRHLLVWDDNIMRAPKEWTVKVFELLRDKCITWDLTAGIEVENVSPKSIEHMAASGCVNMYIPLNLRTVKTNTIPINLREQYKKILESARESGILVHTSHIIGFPEQTLLGMEKQAQFAKEIVERQLSEFHMVLAFSVLPGSWRWNQIMRPTNNGEYEVKESSGLVFEGGWQNWSRYSTYIPQIASRNFTFQQIEKMYYDSIVLINGKYAAYEWFESLQWPKK